MDSSGADRCIASLARPQLPGRLLRLRREQLIAAGYDELSAHRMATERMAYVRTMVAIDDEVPPADSDWIGRLSAPGRAYEAAVAQLHELMLRAARHQVSRMHEAAMLGAARREEIIHSAADEATMAVLSRLGTFEGRSAFTTWAYKFGILHAGTQVRRAAWRDREINLDDVPEPHQSVAPSPELYAEGRDLAQAVRDGLREALTPHQRRVALAILVDEVPIDVLAERLSISRGALYKTLHDARQRLRAYLSAHDFLLPVATRKEVTK
ncbi:MAG: RNA polymerase sigma factor [Microbacteriaceae bacterium]